MAEGYDQVLLQLRKYPAGHLVGLPGQVCVHWQASALTSPTHVSLCLTDKPHLSNSHSDPESIGKLPAQFVIAILKGVIEYKRLKESGCLFETSLVEEISAKSGEWAVRGRVQEFV